MNAVIKMAVLLLRLASHMHSRKIRKSSLTLIQSRSALIKKDGVPIDRAGWLYLPCLEKYSLLFQPEETQDGKIYRYDLPEGSTLEILTPEGVKKAVVTNEAQDEVVIGARRVALGHLRLVA